ncbi:hypothetical protein PG996_005280 [Apiospora saccharicola]|uniref:N-acetyltransferase domain-containing protein n=1 Tax=Apiospora saccharicola TaxID=335842 RepID=A0ABR1VM43_9PEZI
MPASVSPRSAFEVRPARASDIASIVDLLISAPDDATLYQYPGLSDHPELLAPTHRAWVRGLLQDPTSLIRIAVLDSNIVVGFSSWARRVPNADNPGSLQRVKISEPPILDAEEEEQDDGEPMPSIERNKARTDAIVRVRERLSSTSLIQSLPRYSLQGLAVHASHQGQLVWLPLGLSLGIGGIVYRG